LRASFASSVSFLVAAWFGFALRYEMWAAGSPLEEPVCRGAGRSRRRARGDGVCSCGAGSPLLSLWWLSSPGLFSRGRGSDGVIFPRSVVQSLRLCKKGRVCIRTHKHGGYYYDYVLAPSSGRRGGHSSPLQVVDVKAALFRRVLGIFHCPAALAPHRSLAAVRVVPR